AEANLGNAATAKNVLNALQLKRGATPTEGTLDKIYLERRKELYGEGHRLFDIKRLRQPLIRSVYPEQWVAIDLPADSPRFMLPLPNNEMLYNTALTENDQNDYWK
ncbi:MAG: RagB/SusD family nutrient uptake outer membrane protein, partial [Fibrobacter sp.]|nr:RagB/SusD family nutrient uptake outer membrane protein [Fibrobacter sp.]